MNHDHGDESGPAPGFIPHLWTISCGPAWFGVHPSLLYIRPPEPDHDPGDEDDHRNYVPSVHPGIGLRVWAPRR